MKIPLSWLRDYVELELALPEIARALTGLGLEVDGITLVGLPMPEQGDAHEFKFEGLAWDPERIVVAAISEVLPHPNADRLVLCRLDDGQQEHVVLTGAPNLFPYKGQGPLPQPLKVAYAKEGARLYDGHQPGQVLTTLKRTKIRGVESYSMVCSEKELGISEEHEGIIFLEPNAPTGMALAEYMGDAVFEIAILPNMARNASVYGVARELAAALGKPLRPLETSYPTSGTPIEGKARIDITNPELNPRFVLGMVQDLAMGESPYTVQRRLRLAGMRPINNVVDATNYVMLETGQPLHAFDYDRLYERAGGQAPTIRTRTARPGEHLTTLDGVDRKLDDFTVLVTDDAGALSIAGVMGGAETEVSPATRAILLEGAAWNFINIRKTVGAQRLQSEAGYRFSRGVHPALAEVGVRLCLRYLAQWAGGTVAHGLIDAYPAPVQDPAVTLTPADVRRLLGIELGAGEIAALLERLAFRCRVEGEGEQARVIAQTPPHRLDIGEGVVGKADLLEEVARLYGYDRIPKTRLADPLPPQRRNVALETGERVRDLLANLGLQEVQTYRLTTPEREARLALDAQPAGDAAYIRLQNPITPERAVMRRSLLASVLDVLERNDRVRERLALFEVGKVFLPRDGQTLPDEPRRIAVALRGPRSESSWDRAGAPGHLDFFDLKGILEALFDALHLDGVQYAAAQEAPYHPGKCAVVRLGEQRLGVFGQLHPRVQERYAVGPAPVLAAELDLEAIQAALPARHTTQAVPAFPPVLEDIAVIVDEAVTNAAVEAAIRAGGGRLVAGVRLFDIFRGEQIGAGKKSLAYSLTYQAPDRTLTDQEAAQIRQRVVRRLEQDLSARLRSG